jgi:hypothetical protein
LALDRLERWSLVGLPQLNRSVLDGEMAASTVVDTLRRFVLADLPLPERFTPREAQQLVVHLSFTGASVARHYQEAHPRNRATPERAFARLTVGPDKLPFQEYFARAAARTGTGHGNRDTYSSVVRWNTPTCEVRWAGGRIAVLPGAFDDGNIRTYTGDRGEESFLELTKKAETLERGVNEALEPLSDGSVDLDSYEASCRIRLALVLLTVLHRIEADFSRLPPSVGLRADHFMDVFRQFAAHWEVGDIPPSGALDAESLARDLLLGLDVPDYHRQVRRMFPALLGGERAMLDTLMDRRPLPERVLARLGLDAATLAELPAAALRDLVRAHPSLAGWYLLLYAHARVSGAHLALAKKYLFAPARLRAAKGVPDFGLVPRQQGTTGMTESVLELLTRARHQHVLSCLHQIPQLELVALADLPPAPRIDTADAAAMVRFVDRPEPGDRRAAALAAPSGLRRPIMPAVPRPAVAKRAG